MKRTRLDLSKKSAEQIRQIYLKYRLQALIGLMICYSAFYVVRNNFSLSTPYLKDSLHLTNANIGFLISCLTISYGLSKTIMSSLADKYNPKYFMSLGLGLCILINIFLGFANHYSVFVILVFLLGCVQAMGVAPCHITLAKWFPSSSRGVYTSIWNTSHNIGGGIASPIVGFGVAVFTLANWKAGTYWFPAAVALVALLVFFFFLGKGSPQNEGLPPVSQILEEESVQAKTVDVSAPEKRSASYIFIHYVLKNKDAWYIALVDTFVYTIRYGMISWIPIYLLEVKGFTKEEMVVAFLFFEWAAIPSTIIAGWLTDKVFHKYRMPPVIISMLVIFFAAFGYFYSDSLIVTTVFAAIIGCLIYIPQCLTSVQAMDLIPSFAIGSCVSLRGFMSYIVGATLGTALIGVMVEKTGWFGGLAVILSATVLCFLFSILSHLSARKKRQQSEVPPAR